MCIQKYVESKEILTLEEANVHYLIYLKGLADLSGELARRAVAKATNKEYDGSNTNLQCY